MAATSAAPSTPQRNSRFDLSVKPKAGKPLPRLIVVGEPGVGKTSFGAGAPDVVIVPTEDGALGTNTPRIPNEGKCETWDEFLLALRTLRDGEHAYKWACIDTMNVAERLCAEMICKRDFNGVWNSSKNVEGFNAYGKGEKAVASELGEALNLIDALQQRRGMGVILLAHMGLHKQGNALGPDFYKFGAQMSKPSWERICGWADQIGHACREVRAAKEGKEDKAARVSAIGSERWIIFEGGPARDAKSRAGYEMPEKILLSWDEYEKALRADRVGELVAQAFDLVKQVNGRASETLTKRFGGSPTEAQLRELGKQKLEQMIGWLLAMRNQNQEAK